MKKRWKEVGLGLLSLVAIVIGIAGAQPLLHRYFNNVVGASLLTALVLAIYVAGSRWIERRTASELSLRLLPSVLGGFALGLALFATTMGVLFMAGIYHPAAGLGEARAMIGGLVGAIVAGVLEEIIFRGLLFRLSSKILGTWGALLLTAALFGAAHGFNRGATIGSSLAIAIEAGLLLGAVYAATQSLWMTIGLHVGWNFTEGSVFGMTMSGIESQHGLIRGSLSGPTILTGGEFGPEASLVAVFVCLLATSYFLRRMVVQNRAETPAWTKAETYSTAASAT